jgi:dipeptidyl aminopeptidase/acylaminoacyl peptidase
MTIAAGARIGPYEITAPLGQGGMGEVYKARDGRLQRDVAIKVLPPLFASDPERMARFEREAQVLAALNHPNIAQIHGVEENTGVRVSPDGRWVAYETTSTGPSHVFVMSTDGGGPVQVSARTAEVPRWSHDGKTLFFKSDASMVAVDVRTTFQEIDFVNERKLFDGEIAREYDVAPNGDFYTMVPAPEIAYQRQIQIRTRWFEEVERMMRGAK